jgi:hypothetical protein
MSDNYIIIIPKNYDFIPNSLLEALLINEINKIVKTRDSLDIIRTEGIRFIDCGSNFEKIVCPNCGKELEIEFWQEKMDEYFNGYSFLLEKFPLPCCKMEFNLNELVYIWEQGFGKYSIEILNPDIDRLSIENIDTFGNILKQQVKIIYRHI